MNKFLNVTVTRYLVTNNLVLLNYVVNISLLVLTMIIIILGYWQFFDISPIYISKFENSEPPLPIVVHHEDNIKFNFTTDYLKQCKYTVNRYVINLDTNYKFFSHSEDYDIAHYQIGKSFPYSSNIPIMSSWPPGNYKTHSDIIYSCNPIEYIFPKSFAGREVPFIILPDIYPKKG